MKFIARRYLLSSGGKVEATEYIQRKREKGRVILFHKWRKDRKVRERERARE